MMSASGYYRPAAKRYRAASGAVVAVPAPMPIFGAPRRRVYKRRMPGESGEFKSKDTTINAAVIDSTGSVNLINGIARGDDINERTGREIILKSIQINGRIRSTAATGVTQIGRVICVYDRQTNGAAPAITDVLTSNSTTSARNLENRRRFKILMDKVFALSAAGQSGEQQEFRFYRRLRHPVTFNAGDAGTVADIASGSLYILTLGENAPGATAGSTTMVSRVRFQDK